jgi:hypothetical protein
MIKKLYIRLYAIVLLFGGLLFALNYSIGDADSGILDRFGETLTYKIYSGIGTILIYIGIVCFFGLLSVARWSRKFTILFNTIFIIEVTLHALFYESFPSNLFSMFIVIPICILAIWYFSLPAVKLLFDEPNKSAPKQKGSLDNS